MNNQFTKEEIKNSVEYQWRKLSLKSFIVILAITAILMLFCTLIMSLDDIEYIGVTLQIVLIAIAVFTIIFLPFIVYYLYKMIYILRHYEEFKSYEVVLDNISTSRLYRGAIYYTVVIDDCGKIKKVATNAYFSSGIFSKFAVEDFNNKKVVGLYDSNLDKFYIVRLIK